MASLGAEVPEGTARKRLKISRNGKASPSPSITASASASASTSAALAPLPTAEMNGDASKAHIHDGTCHHEAALHTLHTDISAMRDLITCQVCHRFMYEPYALSCGHTYCYSCLTQWLGSNRKKTCPDCRAVISQQPTPSYVIREMVLIFSGRTQLLPDGETSEEHVNNAKEEAELVARDRASTDPLTGGLFKGSFRHGGRDRLMPIRDAADNVDRCPLCTHEIEDGWCNNCNVRVGHDAPSDYDEDYDESLDSGEDLDEDVDEYEGAHAVFGAEDNLGMGEDHPIPIDDDDEDHMDVGVFNRAFNRPQVPLRSAARGPYRPYHLAIDLASASDEEEAEDDDEHDPDMDGFIDYDDASARGYDAMDDTEDEDEDEETVQDVSHRPAARRSGPHVVLSDDDDEGVPPRPRVAISLVDSDDDDEAPVSSGNRRVKRNQAVRSRPIAISSDESDSAEETDEPEQQRQPSSVTGSESAVGGFSPLAEHSDEESTAPSIHYHQSDASSDASHNFGYFDHEAAEEESDDRSDDSDGSSDNNGYGASSSEPIEYFAENDVLTNALAAGNARSLPPSMQNRINRLQTNQQHRSRFFDAPVPASNSRGRTVHPLDLAQSGRRRGGLGQAGPTNSNSNTNAARRPSRFMPATAHPFGLGNTLAGINQRQRAGTTRNGSGNNSNQNSPPGGVQVRSSDVSSSRSSSSGSSDTVGPGDSYSNRPTANSGRSRGLASTARGGRRDVESFARNLEEFHRNLGRGRGRGRGRRAVEEEDEEDGY